MKLATLFAILLCQRAQTIETLDLNYITIRDAEVDIAFLSALKQTRTGKHLQPVTLYEYPTEPKLCPVSLLHCYIVKIETVRKDQAKLLLSFTKPHKAVSTRTASTWLRTSIRTLEFMLLRSEPAYCTCIQSKSSWLKYPVNIKSSWKG